MTITKQAAFSLLEGLTDKSLTLGCLMSNNHQADGNPYKVKTFIRKSTFNGKAVYECYEHDGKKSHFPSDALTVLGHPVTLLEILARLGEETRMDKEKTWKLLVHWRSFGLKTPLRDILEGAKWEDECGCCLEKPKSEACEFLKTEVLKDEKVEALISLLISLQLVK